MEQQATFSNIEHDSVKVQTKRKRFLDKMDKIMSRQDIIDEIKPYYYNNKRDEESYIS